MTLCPSSKHLLAVVAFCLSTALYSQDIHSKGIPTTNPMVLFQYDTAGNQIVRSLCLNCPPLAAKKSNPDSSEENLPFEKFFPEDVISYYPNPVKEELHLKWDLINNNTVHSIQVYSFSGQLLRSYKNLESTTVKNISFQEFSTGTYTVLLQYSNGEQQSIKIIKQ